MKYCLQCYNFTYSVKLQLRIFTWQYFPSVKAHTVFCHNLRIFSWHLILIPLQLQVYVIIQVISQDVYHWDIYALWIVIRQKKLLCHTFFAWPLNNIKFFTKWLKYFTKTILVDELLLLSIPTADKLFSI